MHLTLYRGLSTIFGPLVDLYLMHRKNIGKEDPKRMNERLGHAGLPRPSGSLVWFHAASVGEVVSVLPLIEHIVEEYPDINVLVTTGTVSSSSVIEKRKPKQVIHQYVPVDRVITVRRFLEHWRPSLAIWVESELWPNLIIETHKSGCPMLQVNGRISIKSYNHWQKYKKMAAKMLSCFGLSLAQSDHDKERLSMLGMPNVINAGNLKYDAPVLPADPKETGDLISMIGERPIWIAASTHAGEETHIIDTHKKLKQNHEGILTIIIPRHPERSAELIAHFGKDVNMKLRSTKQEVDESTEIYIADTIGELGIFYRLGGIVFMGGSLIQHGGQNPLEPARLDCALVTGAYTGNFSQIYNELEKEEALLRVDNPDDLAKIVGDLLSDHDLQEKMANTARNIMKSKSGVLENYMQHIGPYLKPLNKSS